MGTPPMGRKRFILCVATSLEVTPGDSSYPFAGAYQSVTAKVLDQWGGGMAGQSISIAVTLTGATGAGISATPTGTIKGNGETLTGTTGTDGTFTFYLRKGTAAGTVSLDVTSGALTPVTRAFTLTQVATSFNTVTPANDTFGTEGDAVEMSIVVHDQGNSPIAGVTVSITVTGDATDSGVSSVATGGSVTNPGEAAYTDTTDANGEINPYIRLGAVEGDLELSIACGSITPVTRTYTIEVSFSESAYYAWSVAKSASAYYKCDDTGALLDDALNTYPDGDIGDNVLTEQSGWITGSYGIKLPWNSGA